MNRFFYEQNPTHENQLTDIVGDASRMDENRLHVAIKGRRDTLLAWVKNSPILVRYSLPLTVKSVVIYPFSFFHSLRIL